MQKCLHCGSADTQPLFDTYQCSNCGGTSSYDGEKVNDPAHQSDPPPAGEDGFYL